MGSDVSGQSVAYSFANLVYAHQPLKASIPIEVSLVLDGWLRNARHLVVIQLDAVQVACGSNWILRRTLSAVHTVNRCCGCCRCVFTCHCFPCFSFFDHSDPCVVVLYFFAFHLFSFLWLEEFIEFVFPSLFWSSHWSVCLVFDAEARVPLCRFLCPCFIWKRSRPHCQTPFHSSVCFNPHVGCFHPFNGCRCDSLQVFNPFFLFSAVPISSSVSFVNCLGRNLCSNCCPLLFHHLTLCGLLFPIFSIIIVFAGLSFLCVILSGR